MRCATSEFLVIFQAGGGDLDHGLKIILGNDSQYVVAGVDINGSASFCPEVRVGVEVVSVNGFTLASCESAQEAEDTLQAEFRSAGENGNCVIIRFRGDREWSEKAADSWSRQSASEEASPVLSLLVCGRPAC